MKNRRWFCYISLVLFTAGLGCTKKSAPLVTEMSPEQLVARGKAIYQLNCITCHNPDPVKEGVLGPIVRGSNRDLLEARILRGVYPVDYKPKRDTQQMPPLPHLEKEIPALEAYLNSTSGAQ